MKRILPVLLGALAGAIGLPIVMWICLQVCQFLLPQFFFTPIPLNLRLIVSLSGWRMFVAAGSILGGWSVILWLGGRTFWPRFASAICSLIWVAIFVSILRREYVDYFGGLSRPFLTDVAFCLPLLTWACALFFFAILARRRTVLR